MHLRSAQERPGRSPGGPGRPRELLGAPRERPGPWGGGAKKYPRRPESFSEPVFGTFSPCFFDQKRRAMSARLWGGAGVYQGSDEHGRHASRPVNSDVPAMLARKRVREQRRKNDETVTKIGFETRTLRPSDLVKFSTKTSSFMKQTRFLFFEETLFFLKLLLGEGLQESL